MKAREDAAPDLAGFDHRGWLGGGGFADVYLYQQRRPQREVAIKVLRESVHDPEIQQQFEVEADAMAAMSAHPNIVTVYAADIAPDGRPFLVMEYYPGGHYLDRARAQRVSIDEVLRVGVQIASAVETAHERGIIHNDIKPANVLVNGYGSPGLTDFGISVASSATGSGPMGASIPYTAPEVLDGRSNGTPSSDVFSLCATLYAVLVGRSPFERPDDRSSGRSQSELLRRVLRDDPPPIGRPDVPASLEYLLRQGLSKEAGSRPRSARALAVSLQGIEQELGLSITKLEVRTPASSAPTGTGPSQAGPSGTGPSGTDPGDDDPTVYGRVQVVDPTRPAGPTRSAQPARPSPVERQEPRPGDPSVPVFGPASRQGGAIGGVEQLEHDDRTHRRSTTPEPNGDDEPGVPEPAPASRRTLVVSTVALGVIVVLGILALVLGGGDDERPDPATETGLVDSPSDGVFPEPLVAPERPVVTALEDGSYEVVWEAPFAQAGDAYRVFRVFSSGDVDVDLLDTVSEARMTYVIEGAGSTAALEDGPCFQIETDRNGQVSELSAMGCAP